MYRDANIFDMHKAQMINTVNRYMQQNVSGAWHGVQSGQTSLNIEVKWWFLGIRPSSQRVVLTIGDSRETVSNQQIIPCGLLCYEKLSKNVTKA